MNQSSGISIPPPQSITRKKKPKLWERESGALFRIFQKRINLDHPWAHRSVQILFAAANPFLPRILLQNCCKKGGGGGEKEKNILLPFPSSVHDLRPFAKVLRFPTQPKKKKIRDCFCHSKKKNKTISTMCGKWKYFVVFLAVALLYTRAKMSFCAYLSCVSSGTFVDGGSIFLNGACLSRNLNIL